MRDMARSKRMANAKILNLALQGGGAHGAFTWGVLDQLLEDGRIEIEGISGTSAGAMNGAVLVQGYEKGGRDGAREALEAFWMRISRAADAGPLQQSFFDGLWGNAWNRDYSPAFMMFDIITRTFSPYQINPWNFNPLREVLEASVEPDWIARCEDIKLFVCATNVRTGKVKIFGKGEVGVDALLASACLPFLFQTIVIDGEPYWDGGYMGNPALFPLIYNCVSRDIAIVQINPMTRDDIPKTAPEILNRLNEISFNSTLMREVRAIAFVQRLIKDEGLDPHKYRLLNMHLIEAEHLMQGLGVASKFNADWNFLIHLRDIGRETAAEWIDRNFDRIGVETTVDIKNVFL